jgi:hypothetical protein
MDMQHRLGTAIWTWTWSMDKYTLLVHLHIHAVCPCPCCMSMCSCPYTCPHAKVRCSMDMVISGLKQCGNKHERGIYTQYPSSWIPETVAILFLRVHVYAKFWVGCNRQHRSSSLAVKALSHSLRSQVKKPNTFRHIYDIMLVWNHKGCTWYTSTMSVYNCSTIIPTTGWYVICTY